MAKNNGRFRLLGIVITLAVLFAGVVGTWAVYGKNIEDNTLAVSELKIDGCKPSIKNKFDIALMRKDIVSIQKTQEDILAEQKEGFQKILNRLPK